MLVEQCLKRIFIYSLKTSMNKKHTEKHMKCYAKRYKWIISKENE